MIFVQFEQTMNPDIVRIFTDELDPMPECDAARRRQQSRLVPALLAIAGIATVVVDRDFITVTRADASYAWVTLWPQIDRVIFALLDAGWFTSLNGAAPMPLRLAA